MASQHRQVKEFLMTRRRFIRNTGFMLGGTVLASSGLLAGCSKTPKPIGMAVEFNAHATSTYVAAAKGWYEDEGLSFNAYDSYVTGVALATALARGDIEVAYMCLVPAITVFANGGIPVKIIGGTHKQGYGLAVNPEKIQSVADLEKSGVSIASVREGGAVDIVLNKTIDVHHLDRAKVLANVTRMNPPKALMNVKAGNVDAVFLPEQWCTMAEEYGYQMLLESKDVWPELQGSVLLVKQNLLEENPQVVEALARTDARALDWIGDNKDEAATILSSSLQNASELNISLDPAFETATGFEYAPAVMRRSIDRIEFSNSIDTAIVQDVIDYMNTLGYITGSFPAEDMLDLRYSA